MPTRRTAQKYKNKTTRARSPSRSNYYTNPRPVRACSCTSVRSSFCSSTRCTSCVAARPVRSGSIVCTSPRRLFSICTTVSTFSSFRTSGIFCRPIRALRTGNTSRTATRSRWFWICATRTRRDTCIESICASSSTSLALTSMPVVVASSSSSSSLPRRRRCSDFQFASPATWQSSWLPNLFFFSPHLCRRPLLSADAS